MAIAGVPTRRTPRERLAAETHRRIDAVVLGAAPTATLISPCVEGSRNIANGHPSTLVRCASMTAGNPSEEPIAGKPHDGICGGESRRWLSPHFSPNQVHRGADFENSCCDHGFSQIHRTPQCKQTVTPHCLNFHPSEAAMLWPRSTVVRSPPMPARCCWARPTERSG